MELQEPNMQTLFAQLGEADDDASITRFIEKNACEIEGSRLHEAAFWSPTQAAFLRESIQQDAQWAPVVDSLSVQLHQAHKSRSGA